MPDNEGLYAFVIDRLTTRREVADVRTAVVYEHLRRAVEPAPAAIRSRTARPGGPAGRNGARRGA